MSWKSTLSLGLLLLAAVVLVPRFSSKADAEASSFPQQDGKITRYENGMTKIEPEAFAVSGPASRHAYVGSGCGDKK